MFSISLIAHLFLEGANLLFLCGYHMARDEFLEQTGASSESVLVDQEEDVAASHHKRVVFISRETPQLFGRLIEELPDITERVVFVKNIELFDGSILESTKGLPRLVVSGDIEACAFKTELLQHVWRTRISFSKLGDDGLPDLPKYSGYLEQKHRTGIVTLGEVQSPQD